MSAATQTPATVRGGTDADTMRWLQLVETMAELRAKSARTDASFAAQLPLQVATWLTPVAHATTPA